MKKEVSYSGKPSYILRQIANDVEFYEQHYTPEDYRELERIASELYMAWYECPEDSVPDILQDVFIKHEAKGFRGYEEVD